MSVFLTQSGKILLGAIGGALVISLAIATFQGWLLHSTDIFLAAIQGGVSWCF